MLAGDVNEAEYWEEHYRQSNTGWDLGAPAPPFVDLLQEPGAPQPGRMIVLGAGRGNDAVFFAQHGFGVTAVDFAEGAVQATEEHAEQAHVQLEAVQYDIFSLPPEYSRGFKYVLEHTCFCTIDPARKSEYVQLVRKLLQPDGLYIALFFTHGRPGGPPYTTSPGEVQALFEPYFAIERLETPARSVKSRQGKELLAMMRPLPPA